MQATNNGILFCRTIKTYHNHCSGDRQGLSTNVTSWMHKIGDSKRIDLQVCKELHCGNGYCEKGPEVLEDLEYD